MPILERVPGARARPRLRAARPAMDALGGRPNEAIAWAEKGIALAHELGIENVVRHLQMRGIARIELGDPAGSRGPAEGARPFTPTRSRDRDGNLVPQPRRDGRPVRGPVHGRSSSSTRRSNSPDAEVSRTTRCGREAARLVQLYERGEWDELLREADEVLRWDRRARWNADRSARALRRPRGPRATRGRRRGRAASCHLSSARARDRRSADARSGLVQGALVRALRRQARRRPSRSSRSSQALTREAPNLHLPRLPVAHSCMCAPIGAARPRPRAAREQRATRRRARGRRLRSTTAERSLCRGAGRASARQRASTARPRQAGPSGDRSSSTRMPSLGLGPLRRRGRSTREANVDLRAARRRSVRRARGVRSAAGVGARRRRALLGLGQLGGRERGAVQDVALGHFDLREAVGVSAPRAGRRPPRRSRERGPARFRGRRAAPRVVMAASRSSCSSTEASEIRWPCVRAGSYSASPRSSVASVVTVPATPIALPARSGGRSERTYALAAASSGREGGSEERKRSVRRTQPMSRLVADATLPSGRDHELGRAAADVDDEHVVQWIAAGRDAADHQRRLLLSGEQLRREPIAPFDLAEERLAVLRVSHRARRDRERALGAVSLEHAAILREAVAHARDGNGKEAPALGRLLRRAA